MTYWVATKIRYIDQRHVCPGAIIAKLERFGGKIDTVNRELISRRKRNLCSVLLELNLVVVTKGLECVLKILDSVLMTL